MKKIIHSTRAHLLIIAASLVLLTGILSLSAYLTDQETAHFSFNTFEGAGVNITLAAESHTQNADLIPGSISALDPVITNAGTLPAYVFLTTESDELSVTGDLGSGWTLISNNNHTFYVYGTSTSLTPLEASMSTPAAFETVMLNPDIDSLSSMYDMTLDAYAIQTTCFENASPIEVFEAAVGNVSND